MQQRVRVLHLSTHLGGGVGRVLSRLAIHRRSMPCGVEDLYVCLEAPKDTRFSNAIINAGAPLVIAPPSGQLAELIATADVLQLEWWHHPLMATELNALGAFSARTVVWAHVSGLHYPAVPPTFITLPHAFVATTPASVGTLRAWRDTIDMVNSTGGFDDLPVALHRREGPLRFGYLGSLNPAKLHPAIDDFAAAVTQPDFVLELHGDPVANPGLAGVSNSRLRICGFAQVPGEILAGLDVMVYLLNPTHYGSTENSLLEAMACGVVPIVLNNPAESAIVSHMETGLVVDGPSAFAQAVNLLHDAPQLRKRLSRQAAETVRKNYSASRCAAQLEDIYRRVMTSPKTKVDFRSAFGHTPSQIFRSCLGEYADCFADGVEVSAKERRRRLPFLYEASKSSVFQFHQYLPEDTWLAHWAETLRADQAGDEDVASPSRDRVQCVRIA